MIVQHMLVVTVLFGSPDAAPMSDAALAQQHLREMARNDFEQHQQQVYENDYFFSMIPFRGALYRRCMRPGWRRRRQQVCENAGF